jgi:hypothetical protein
MRKLNFNRPTPTTAIAVTALVFSITGSSYAAATIAAKNSVKSSSIVNSTIKSADIGAGAVGTSDLADGAVINPKLGDGSVSNAKLADGSVSNGKLGDGSVSTGKLADGSVSTPKLGDGSVTTPKLGDGSVTTPKLADRSVTRGKLAVGATPSFAVVAGSNGVLNRSSSDVLGSGRTGTGTYLVTLDHDVTGCAYIATLGGITTTLYSGVVSAAQQGTNPNQVAIRTGDTANAATDHSFHLAVVC